MYKINDYFIEIKKKKDSYYLKNILTNASIAVDENTLSLIKDIGDKEITYISNRYNLSKKEIINLRDYLIKKTILTNSDKFYDIKDIPNIMNESFSSIDNKIMILGIPYDGAASGMTGQKFFPNKFRNKFDFNQFSTDTLVDIGNIRYIEGESSESFHNKIYVEYQKLRKKTDNIIIVFGGDHSITYPIVKAINKKVKLIKIDAHFDSFFRLNNQPINHSNFINEIRDLKHVEKIFHVGARENISNKLNLSNDILINSENNKIFDYINFFEKNLSQKDNIYISLDFDVIDPSEFNSANYLINQGMTTDTLINLLKFLFNFNVIGIDFVEYNPVIDLDNKDFDVVEQIIKNVINIIKECYK